MAKVTLIEAVTMALAIELMDRGAKVFLDLKLFDIGQTIENAVRDMGRMEEARRRYAAKVRE